jgi:hypothetical protein
MRIITLLFIVLFFSCSENRESNLPRIIIPEVDSVIEVNSNHMLQSRPVYLGINFDKDTIINTNKLRANNSHVKFKYDTILPKYDLKIFIDTSYNFNCKDFEYKWMDLSNKIDSLIKLNYTNREIEPDLITKVYYNKLAKIRKKYVKAYPLLIYNSEFKDVFIYDGLSGFQLIQEAKDIDGKWKPIEYLNNLSSDLISPFFNKLNSKKYLATSIIKYHGNFKTKLRVKIRLNNHYYYSNEIEGLINQSQFNDDFLNFKFYTIFDPNLDDEWFKIKKEYSLLKKEL